MIKNSNRIPMPKHEFRPKRPPLDEDQDVGEENVQTCSSDVCSFLRKTDLLHCNFFPLPASAAA